MFHLKFISRFSDGSNTETSISCSRYDIYRFNDGGTEITVFPEFTNEGGVTFFVGNEEQASKRKHTYYEMCYITNEKGITVDKI